MPSALEGDFGMWVSAEPGHPGTRAPRRGAGLQRCARQGGHGFVLPHRRTLAGKGQELLGLASGTADAREASGQDTTTEKALELAQHETRWVTTWVLVQPLPEAGEVLMHETVERLLLGLTSDPGSPGTRSCIPHGEETDAQK